MSIINLRFNNGQQYNNTQKTAIARQIKIVVESIDSLKLSTLSTQVKYILTFIVNVEKQPDEYF